jgi:uncharacterized membrane protein
MKQRGKLRFFGHPVHPIVTHFPMALLPVSLLSDLLGLGTGASSWWSVSFYNLAIGLVLSIPALITGIADFLAIPQGGPAERAAIRHMFIIVTGIMLYTGSFFIRFGLETLTGWRLMSAISLSFVGLVFLLIGGWYGGQLVYRYAVGNEPGKDKSDSGNSTTM